MSIKVSKNENITLIIAHPQIDTSNLKEIFIKSFYNTYRYLPILDLNPKFQTIADVENWFASSFDEEISLFKENKSILIIGAIDETTVGLVFFEKLSFNSVSLRNLAIAADYQKLGIGKHLVFSILKSMPELEKIYVVVNRLNQVAIKFYRNVGFHDSNHTREGYDSNKYISLEWNI